ncbi:LytTR family DNA-binding domain-containing protein [Pedomonas sp. V897]|uniref:LytTR family DNA-binding domain-containing protein n=1 Tax=Pedomonas sp. V897 TaxID=3446482 RepID=UPI003EE35AF2
MIQQGFRREEPASDGPGVTGAASAAGRGPLAPADVRRGYAVITVAIALIVGVNIVTLLHDRVGPGGLAAWEPVVWELTSGLMLVACAAIPLAALRRAPFGAVPWPRLAVVHLAASLAFSVLHVAGMVALRTLAYAAMGGRYAFGRVPAEFIYEYGKDLTVYGLIVTVFWVSGRLSGAGRDAGGAPGEGEPAATAERLDLRDGSRLISVPYDEVICARADGNYVEFTLADGRQPLVRTTLAATERQLGARGFVRTHRSWLVNLAHVRESLPTGSGDFLLRLSQGVEAPLSRRYGPAVEKIRRRGGQA